LRPGPARLVEARKDAVKKGEKASLISPFYSTKEIVHWVGHRSIRQLLVARRPDSRGHPRHPRVWHCPVDFDAAKCLPPKLRKYEQEAIYLLGLIHWQQAMRFNRALPSR
jgi:hypothetical protein